MHGRAFIFCGVAAGEDMAYHKEHLHNLVKRLDAPCLAWLSAHGRVGANALWSRRRAAAVPAGMQAMEAVVVPAPGAWAHDEEKEVEKEVVEGVEEDDMGILWGWSSGGSVGESPGESPGGLGVW
ncbi:hypothetical protein I7I48_09396 [Histoplasma ohiense]|nr:hypothetical protein I7I48_09396 [Histoplasma ohiense (nom. inval.)]